MCKSSQLKIFKNFMVIGEFFKRIFTNCRDTVRRRMITRFNNVTNSVNEERILRNNFFRFQRNTVWTNPLVGKRIFIGSAIETVDADTIQIKLLAKHFKTNLHRNFRILRLIKQVQNKFQHIILKSLLPHIFSMLRVSVRFDCKRFSN